MAAVANLLFYIALALITFGALVNIRRLAVLPFSINKKARWASFTYFIMLFGLAQWLGREGGIEGTASVDASATLQIVSILIAAFVLVSHVGKTFKVSNFKFPFILLFLFALMGVLTSPVSDVPALSLFKASSLLIAVIITVMAVKSLEDSKNPELLFNTVYVYFCIIAILAIIGGILYPEMTHMQNEGVFGFMLFGWPRLNPNSLSYIAAVVFVVSLRRIYIQQAMNSRLLYIALCGVGFTVLILAQGRTSIFSSTLAVLFMSFFIKEMRSLRWVIAAFSIVLMLLFFVSGSVGDWTNTVADYLQRGVTDEDLSTMSGRTHAWDISWRLFLESPVTGYGFYAAGKTLLAPHNAYFTILLNGGLLGFIPWVMAILGGMYYITRHLKDYNWRKQSEQNNTYKELIAVMIVQFVRTITGQDLTIHSYSMLAFLSVLVYVIVRENSPDSEQVIEVNEKVEDVDSSEKYKSVRLR